MDITLDFVDGCEFREPHQAAIQDKPLAGGLVLCNTIVRRDAAKRYCLNDLHKAAVANGANKRSTEPGKFFRSPRTQSLIQILREESAAPNWGNAPTKETTPIWGGFIELVSTTEGRGGATYVCLELVIAYGQFVSAAFDLMVIRTFIGVANREHALPHIQSRKFWHRLRPHWAQIADLALQGLTNRAIAAQLGRSAGSVGRCLIRMYEVGYLNPVEVFAARLKPATAARWAITKPVAAHWGRPEGQPEAAQLPLFAGGGA